MSAAGRYLVCSACQLSFKFPPGVPYLTITRQFESQLCGSAPILSKSTTSPHRPRPLVRREGAGLAGRKDDTFYGRN